MSLELEGLLYTMLSIGQKAGKLHGGPLSPGRAMSQGRRLHRYLRRATLLV